MFRFLYLLALAGLCNSLYALWEVKPLAISESGRSFLLPIAQMHQINRGDYAAFAYNAGTVDLPKLVPIAVAEVLKVRKNLSYWYVIKRYQLPEGVDIASFKLLVMPKKDLLAGRRELRFRLRKIIGIPGKKDQLYLPSNEGDLPDQLIVEKEGYGKTEKLNLTNLEEGNDVEMAYLESMTSDGGVELKHTEQISTSYGVGSKTIKDLKLDTASYPTGETFDDDKIRDTIVRKDFEKMFISLFESFLKKVNVKDRDYLADIQKDETGRNRAYYYDKEIEERKESRVKQWARNKVYNKNEEWSKDLSDEELQKFFIDSGMMEEVYRKREALELSWKSNMIMRFGVALSKGTTDEDPNSHGRNLDLTFIYELLLGRIWSKLRSFSLSPFYSQGSSYYADGTHNVEAKEKSYGALLSYYPFIAPAAVQKFIPYFGIGLETGSADGEIKRLYKKTQYQIAPTLFYELGFKSRFYRETRGFDFASIGYGYAASLTYTPVKLSQTSTVDDSESGTLATNELKFSLGFLIFF